MTHSLTRRGTKLAEETRQGSTANTAWWTLNQAPDNWRRTARWGFLLLVCAYVGFCYASHPSFLNLELYTRGEAATPYQYRVLPMQVIRLLLRLDLFRTIASWIQPLDRSPYRLALAVIGAGSLLGAMLATRATIRRLTSDAVFAFWSAFLLALMAQIDLASSWNAPFITPYDVPSLMFFAWLIALVVQRRWIGFYIAFVLAVLNRETACFATVFFAIWEWVRLEDEGRSIKQRLTWIMPHVVAQAFVWIAIKLMLQRVFSQNPTEAGAHGGGMFITHFVYNVGELLKPQQWPLLLSVCGFSLPFLWIQRRWIGVRGLQLSLAIVLPLWFVGLMIVGVVVEIRIFGDWIALAAPSVAMIVWNRFRPVGGIETKTRL